MLRSLSMGRSDIILPCVHRRAAPFPLHAPETELVFQLIYNVTSLVESKRKAEQQMPLHYLSSSTALADGEQSDDGADTPKIYGDTPFYLVSLYPCCVAES